MAAYLLAHQLTRRIRAVGLVAWVTVAGAIVGVIVAAAVAWLVESAVTDLMLAQVAARAADQVQLGVLHYVRLADFEPPYTPEKLGDLGARLDPLLARARQDGSGIIRLNLYARDGTIVYSDLASLRGRVVSPLANPGLARALAGTAGTEISSLIAMENADLQLRYGRALEAYIPFSLDGQVVGVYEFYQELPPVPPIRPLVWGTVLAGFGILIILSHVAVRSTAVLLGRLQGEREHLVAAAVAAARGTNGSGQNVTSGDPALTVPVNGRTAGMQRPAAVGPELGASEPDYGLTPRELEVLRLMATNHTYRDIANELVVGEETVRSHVKSVLHKLGRPDRTQAVVAAIRAGILRLP